MVAARRKAAPLAPAPPRPHFASHPSEEELIRSFLRPRVVSGDRPCAFIHDADVYSACPGDLTDEFAPAVASNGDRAWYFFSAVRSKGREGQRKARTVETGEGCWHSEAGAKPVVEEPGRPLGHRQSFSFVTKVDGRRVRSGWLMVELGVDDADDMVLCKIYFSPRARAAESTAAGSSARHKRKAATYDDKINRSPVHQRRRARPTQGGAPHDDVTADAEEKDSTQGGGLADENSVADDPAALWTDDSLFSRCMRATGVALAEKRIRDRPDEELRKDLGLEKYLRLLNDHGGFEPPPPCPSPTAGYRGLPSVHIAGRDGSARSRPALGLVVRSSLKRAT